MGIRRTNRPLSTVISGKGFRMVNRQSAVSATLVPLSSQTSSCHLLSSFVSIPILVRLSRTFQRSLPPPTPIPLVESCSILARSTPFRPIETRARISPDLFFRRNASSRVTCWRFALTFARARACARDASADNWLAGGVCWA